MVQDYLQHPYAYPKGGQLNTGDGIYLSAEVGAQLWHMSNTSGPDLNCINPETGRTAGFVFAGHSSVIGHDNNFCTDNPAIIVGADGTRFNDEGTLPGRGFIHFCRAWVHGIMSQSHPLATHPYIDLEGMAPYPMLFPSLDFMETLGCWCWMRLREARDSHILEFHGGRTLHEIQLQLFNSPGVSISQGIHTDLAPGLAQVPFTPESPRVEEHVCWKTGAKPHVVAFFDFLRRYYAERPQAFGSARPAGEG